MVELKGSLSGIGLPAIVQLVGDLHHTGTLELSRGEATGLLAFDDGRLVAAECGDIHGLQAIAACAVDLADADFVFFERQTLPDHTLDLGPVELKRILSRLTNGEVTQHANGTAETATDSACPLLGFADDRNRHYARPTALHRCFAGGAPGLVTPTEQRELCLSGRFTTCPRFRTAEQLQLQTQTQIQAPPRQPVLSPPPPPDPEATLIAPPTPAATPPSRAPMPPGVAARLAAAGPMRVSAPADQPTIQTPPPRRQRQPEPEVDDEERPRRGVLLIAGGALAGLVLVALIMLVAAPLFRNLGQKPAAPGASSSIATVPAPTSVPVVAQPAATIAQPTLATNAQPTPPGPQTLPQPQTAGAQATGVPTRPAQVTQPRTVSTFPPTPTAIPRPATPAAAAAPAAGTPLLDVRFVNGAAPNWLDNQPYAHWSDGAYRFQAKDAARFVAVGVPLPQVLSDVIVSATFRKTGGPPGGGYGLIVRTKSPAPLDGVNQNFDAYVLETGDLGEYGVWRREADHWVDLVPWMRSTAVRSGGSPNDLTAKAVGDQLTFTVNGIDLASVQDDTLDAGGVGLFIGGDYNEVALDRFTVSSPS